MQKKRTNILLLISVIFIFLNNLLYSQVFDAKKIYEECADAVVLIFIIEDEEVKGIGTGFFINEQGYIITNKHVILNEAGYTYKPYNLKIFSKDKIEYSVSFVDEVASYPDLDIAIIKCNTYSKDFLPIVPTVTSVGEDIVAIGHPNGDAWNQSKGIVSKTDVYYNKYLLQVDISIDEGNSGGPLINSFGQVVGVVASYAKMYDNKGELKTQETGKFAIKSEWVKKILYEKRIKYFQNIKISNRTNSDNLQYDEKLKEIERREQQIKEKEKRDKQIIERERSERQKVSIRQSESYPRLAIEGLINPSYLYDKNTDLAFVNLRYQAGLFLQFGFIKDDYSNSLRSNRIGIIYSSHRNYDLENYIFLPQKYFDLSIALELYEYIRLGAGRSFANNQQFLDMNNYNLLYIHLNFTDYPLSFGLSSDFYTNNKFKLQHYTVGLFLGLNFSILRI